MYMPHAAIFAVTEAFVSTSRESIWKLSSACTHNKKSLSESSVAVQMQGGCVSAHAAAISTVQAPAMCHRAIATVQAPAMCYRAVAAVQAPAMCHCQKLSRAGVHTSGVPHASFRVSY